MLTLVSQRMFSNSRKHTSKPEGFYDFLERQDRKIFRKVSNAKGHPLLSIMPRVKPSSDSLRKETFFEVQYYFRHLILLYKRKR